METERRQQVVVVVLAIVFALVVVTWVRGCSIPELGAADAVNAGCAGHGGIESWGGNDSYSATCKDGYAFSGGSGVPIENMEWGWPW